MAVLGMRGITWLLLAVVVPPVGPGCVGHRGSVGGEQAAALAEPMPPSPGIVRHRMRYGLEASGPADPETVTEATRVFGLWKRAVSPLRGRVTFSEVTCFAVGCMATASYGDMRAVEAADRILPASDAFHDWSGVKYRSPVEILPTGMLVADWVLFRPDRP